MLGHIQVDEFSDKKTTKWLLNGDQANDADSEFFTI